MNQCFELMTRLSGFSQCKINHRGVPKYGKWRGVESQQQVLLGPFSISKTWVHMQPSLVGLLLCNDWFRKESRGKNILRCSQCSLINDLVQRQLGVTKMLKKETLQPILAFTPVAMQGWSQNCLLLLCNQIGASTVHVEGGSKILNCDHVIFFFTQ